MGPDPLAVALDRLWRKNRPELLARAARVEAALIDGVADPIAAEDAHVLAGALGTYGRPGSALFATAEDLLTVGDPAARTELAAAVRTVLAQLADERPDGG